MQGHRFISLRPIQNIFLATVILIAVNIRCSASPPNSENSLPVGSSDEYLLTNQRDCFSSKKLFSCFKYKAAKYLWSIATNRFNFVQLEKNIIKDTKIIPTINDNDDAKAINDNGNDKSSFGFHFVQLKEPSSLILFPEARNFGVDDNEITKAWKFMQRMAETFLQGHGVSLAVSNSLGARVYDSEEVFESRGRRRKRMKWLIIFPLIILMKIAHLKMTIIPFLLGIGGMQLILLFGGSYLLYYLKHHTLCRIDPHLVQSHAHVYHDSDYSTFAAPWSSSGHSRDWAANRVYDVYNYHAKS